MAGIGRPSIDTGRFLEPGAVLTLAVWFGLATGLAQAALQLMHRAVSGVELHGPIDIVWMAPVAAIVVFGLLGTGVVLVCGRQGRVPLGLCVSVFTFLACFDILLLVPRIARYAATILALGIAIQTGRVAGAHPEWLKALVAATLAFVPRRPQRASSNAEQPSMIEDDGLVDRRQVLVGAGVTVAGLTLATRAWPAVVAQRARAALPSAAPGVPNVLLVVLDTVRAHNLSVYGYARPTTPNLQRLAGGGVTFTRALSTAPWTLPSHASMFTGRFPHELSTNWRTPLDATHPTLAEVLGGQGYLTAGFVANTEYCSYEYGLNRGFAQYQDYRISLGLFATTLVAARTVANAGRIRRLVGNDERLDRQPADLMTASFLGWLSGVGSRPFFAFVNYYDAHAPYLPPPSFDRRFGPPRRQGKLSPLQWNWDPTEGHRPLTPEELREEIDAYDGALAYLDSHLGLIFDELRRRGLRDNTLVIVTSDHGEEFGEHGIYEHGSSLYLASVHVPLVMAFPGHTPAGLVVDEPVTLRDLAATVLDLLGVQHRPPLPGVSLTRFWHPPRAGEPADESPILTEVRKVKNQPAWFPSSKGDMTSLVAGGFRYIRNSDGTEELYDFERDPWERVNLAGAIGSAPHLDRFRRLLSG